MAGITLSARYHNVFMARLKASGAVESRRDQTTALHAKIIENCDPATLVCRKSGSVLGTSLGISDSALFLSLRLLESIGAISRDARDQPAGNPPRDGRTRLIHVTPSPEFLRYRPASQPPSLSFPNRASRERGRRRLQHAAKLQRHAIAGQSQAAA
jgi:hypothetical protein